LLPDRQIVWGYDLKHINEFKHMQTRGMGETVKVTVLHRPPIMSSRLLMIVLASLTASAPSAARASSATRVASFTTSSCDPELHSIVHVCVACGVPLGVGRAGIGAALERTPYHLIRVPCGLVAPLVHKGQCD